jgi:hypothetical protein
VEQAAPCGGTPDSIFNRFRLSEKRVVGEIEDVLTGKGWGKADAATADATVLLHGATESRKRLNPFHSGGSAWGWGGMGSGTVQERDSIVGTLAEGVASWLRGHAGVWTARLRDAAQTGGVGCLFVHSRGQARP